MEAASLLLTGDSLMYIETEGNISSHENVFVRFERTGIYKISNLKFFYNRFSNSTGNLK